MGQAIEKIANLVGADYYVDENDDLHFYDPTDLTSSPIASSQILNATIKRILQSSLTWCLLLAANKAFGPEPDLNNN